MRNFSEDKRDASSQSATRLPPLWLLVGVSALGPLVLNGVLPANTVIMQELGTDYGNVQLILTVYLFATMVAQIVMGSFADRIGRRPVMIGNLFIFSVGGLVCMSAPNIEILLAGRFIQGFGASVCMFLPRTVVRDVYPRNRSASVIGYMTTAMMAAPLFGPALGGWITDISSWRWMYAGLAALGFVFVYLTFAKQNETLVTETDKSGGVNLLANARILLSRPVFVSYLLIQCASVGVYYCFLGGAPYILMELRGISASSYGLWFMMIASGYLLGNLAAGKFSEKTGVDRMIQISLIPGLIGIVLFWALYNWHHPLGMFLPMQLVAFSNGMCLPNLMSAIMSVRSDLAGGASGLAGTAQTAIGILFTLLLSIFMVADSFPFYLLITLSAILGLYGYSRLFWFGTADKQV